MSDFAIVGGRLHTRLRDVTSDLGALDSVGSWVVALPFDSEPVCARFDDVRSLGSDRSLGDENTPSARPLSAGDPKLGPCHWSGVDVASWRSSLDETAFTEGVERIRSEIAAGNVYQVNLTRRLSAPLHPDDTILGLWSVLSRRHYAPYGSVVSLPSQGVLVASASPERFVERSGRVVRSSPIKGTASDEAGFLEKDYAENVMIVDLVRNDLGRICEWGSVHVSELLATEAHPGLFHLVSTVEGTLRPHNGWAEIVAATFPPGSVTGAPKIAALDMIRELEPVERSFYCGAIGWVDADTSAGELSVAIRTFWIEDGRLNFSTGGGITFDSSAEGEWRETELKANRLLLAAGERS